MSKELYDYSKLKGRIVEICGTISEFAEKMETTQQTISSKLHQKSCFKQDEIIKAMKILELNPELVGIYFFTLKG